jgi:glycosyltransferase involved in cell wall biosynthesis
VPNSSASCVADGVAVVTHDLAPYGAQRVTVSLVESLTGDFSTSCEVVSLGGGPLAVPLRRIAPVHNVGQTWKFPARDLGPLLHAIHRRGYRKAILNTVISGVAAPPLRDLGFRIVGLVHEMPELIAGEALEPRLGQMLASAHVVVFPHETVRYKIENAFPDLKGDARIECFPQGLIRRNPWRNRTPDARDTVRQSLGIAAESPIVLGVGIGDLRKGVDLFFDSARIVNERLAAPCHFVWIGPIDDALKSRLLKEERLTDPPAPYLRLLGFQEDTAPYHSAADVFALTSREDPFPNVVLESMDAGVPVVAFADSGGGAHLAQTVAGRVVTPFDVDAYAGAIIQLLGDRDLHMTLAPKLQRIVDAEFAFRRYTQRLLELLQAAA